MISISRLRDVKSNNRVIMRDEFALGKTEVRAMPRILFVELTRFCNLACQMCREPQQIGREQKMSLELFERVAAELFPTAEIVDLRGWGESLILPEWPHRLAVARSYGCEIRIVTNLSFHRPKTLEGLIEARAWVGISLDGAAQEVLAATRRGGRLSLIYENLGRLGAAYRAAGISSRLRLYTTCQRPNLASLENIVDIAEACGIPVVSLSPVTVSPDSLVSIQGMSQQLEEAIHRARERAALRHITLVQTASLWEGQFAKETTEPCIHPWTHCYVAFDGNIGFCDHLIGLHGDSYVLGNLLKTPFLKVWNGDAWQELRLEHLNARRATASHFAECSWCYRNRFTDFEDLLEPRLAEGRKYIHQPF
jgi:MoaA/NifB/PqqE/SkfB family radical SAM enzyme